MENSPLLPKGYTDKTNALRAKYLPIEMDPNLTVEEKIPHMEAWYKQANKLLQETGIQRDLFSQFVKTSNLSVLSHFLSISMNQCLCNAGKVIRYL